MSGSKKIEMVLPHELVIIGLDTEDREEHPLFDERVYLPLDEMMVRNIRCYGIQQAVLIRREAGVAYVVDGRQRVRAAREAYNRQGKAGEHQVKVPTQDVRGDDARVAGIMISTNEIRRGDEVLAKALKAVRLLDTTGDIHAVAIAFGRSPTQIRNWLSLAEADSSIHAAIKTGAIGATAGIELARYPKPEQAAAVARAIGASGGKQVSEAAAKKDRQQQGHSSSGGASSATAASSKTTNTQSRAQSGIKRTWIRDALKTNAGKNLSGSQKALLKWVATGESSSGTWYDSFQSDAEMEMEAKRREKKK